MKLKENVPTYCMNKVLATCYAYGAIRNLVYAPKMKQDEYVTDRLVKYLAFTAGSPILAPAYLLIDIKNIEHIIRKMPGPIDNRPWY